MSKICQSCGKQLDDAAQFCDGCGASFAGQQQSQTPPPPPPPPPGQGYGQNQYNQAPPNAGQNAAEVFSPDDIEKNKTIAGLAYLIFFLPMIACPESRFGRFHANQAFLVFLIYVASGIISIIPFLGWVIGPLGFIFGFVMMIIGLMNGLNGKAQELPLIGKIRILH